MKTLATLTLSILLTCAAQAALDFYEPFDYSAGALTNVSGGNWTSVQGTTDGAWTCTNVATVNGSLVYAKNGNTLITRGRTASGTLINNGPVRDIRTLGTNYTTGLKWASWLTVDTSVNWVGSALEFLNTGGTYGPWGGSSVSSPNAVRLGMGGQGSAWSFPTPVTGSDSVTAARFIVFKCDFDANPDLVTFYVDPDPGAADPAASAVWSTGCYAYGNVTFDRLEMQRQNYTIYDTYIDEIRIGDTYADVSPYVPEPAAAAGAAVMLVALLRRGMR